MDNLIMNALKYTNEGSIKVLCKQIIEFRFRLRIRIGIILDILIVFLTVFTAQIKLVQEIKGVQA